MDPVEWRRLDSACGPRLSTMRVEAHWAAQVAAAPGTAWLTSEDFSHTSLRWHRELEAMVGQPVQGYCGGLRVPDLTWLLLTEAGEVVDATTAVDKTLMSGLIWLAERLAAVGVSGHFLDVGAHREELPEHPVSNNGRFTAAGTTELAELASWYGNAAGLLADLGGPVRIWPHHFDMGVAIDLGEGRSVSAGMSPGDGGIDEPYLYVTAWPYPEGWETTKNAPLKAGAFNDAGWFGAVLRGSEVAERDGMAAFLEEAMHAVRARV